jgi:prophage maintenance system killer protein
VFRTPCSPIGTYDTQLYGMEEQPGGAIHTCWMQSWPRPKQRFTAGVTGLPELAACYAASIVADRSFASGNLAAAFVLPATFLGLSQSGLACGADLTQVGHIPHPLGTSVIVA